MQRLHRPPQVMRELEGHDPLAAILGAAAGRILGGFGSIVDAIFGTVNDEYVRDLPVINDHSQTIGQMRAELDQLTIHGLARVLTGDGVFYASPGTVRADVVMLAAGAGGGTGRWDLVTANRHGGSGGGGGGEVHFTIHGTALFDEHGNPRPIYYTVGAGGRGGIANEESGTGGGNTTFDGIVAYGGQGGRWAGGGGAGGYGIVIGGSAGPDYDAALKDSLSPYGLFGGGGAGGRGSNSGLGNAGGRGGLNAAGAGTSGRGGDAPPVASIAPTGGGGGGGGAGGGYNGGNGAFPAGGGGGGGGSSSSSNIGGGGLGGNGAIYIIERSV